MRITKVHLALIALLLAVGLLSIALFTTKKQTSQTIQGQTNSIVVPIYTIPDRILNTQMTLIPQDGLVSTIIESTAEISSNKQKVIISTGKCTGRGQALFELPIVSDFSEVEIATTLSDLESQAPLSVWIYEEKEGSDLALMCGDILFK